jgi:prepilin-type N-terminal cleavage/methylation domain-containing protein/prepilin-type processing-associated H-X9-DG protein
MKSSNDRAGFTLIEVLAVAAVLSLMGMMFCAGLAQTRPETPATQCRANLKRLTLAWQQYAEDNQGLLLTSADGLLFNGTLHPSWMAGYLDFSSLAINWDPTQSLARSPLWAYVQRDASLFRCPSDPAKVTVNGVRLPRVRSMSMSQVFARGEWLDRSFNSSQNRWRTYHNLPDVLRPAQTFVFIDEHPDSMNDSAFANPCTGNQPGDPPASSQIIDFPANYHHGGCGISFADGHAEIHKWVGSKIGRAPLLLNGTLPLNVNAGDSWTDMHWLATNTTVKN